MNEKAETGHQFKPGEFVAYHKSFSLNWQAEVGCGVMAEVIFAAPAGAICSVLAADNDELVIVPQGRNIPNGQQIVCKPDEVTRFTGALPWQEQYEDDDYS